MDRIPLIKDGVTYLVMAVLVVAAAFGTGWLVISIVSGRMGSADASNWFVAVGTLGAVAVALYQNIKQRSDASSDTFRREATQLLATCVADFVGRVDGDLRPLNDRRHWLNFARGIATARKLANQIKGLEQKLIWSESEHYWRERVYDVLSPTGDSFPAQYYGYVADQKHKNLATSPGERASLSEASLVLVYRWVTWPSDRPDPLDRNTRFSSEDIENMETFGPRGLAEYIRILRKLTALPP